MKTPSNPATTAMIASGQFFSVDLFTFTLTSGLVIRLTSADFDVIDDLAQSYSCGSIGSGFPRVDSAGSKITSHFKRGLDSDSSSVVVMPTVQDPFSGSLTYPDVVGSIPWLAACRIGLFDNADVKVSRGFYASPPTPPYTKASRTCVGTLAWVRGVVGTVDGNQTSTTFRIDDYKSLLTVNMPRNLYQSSCRHQLYDTGCTLAASSFAKTGTVAAGSSRANIIASVTAPPGSATFTLGRIQFTSGQNSGFTRSVASWDGVSNFSLQSPFPFAPAVGDAFTAYAGCDKQMATCNMFGNIVNFGGNPFIPPPEVTLG
jgi:hypothetical protein